VVDVSPPPSGRSSTSVAFRLKRPYASEDELVAGDAHGIRKSGMLLFGAAPRPVGLIVRFEVALQDGTPVFRGEGKVVAYHPAAPPPSEQPAALQVKFTRLDPRGKAVVDRAVLRNEGRPPSAVRSPLSLPPPPDSGPISSRDGSAHDRDPHADALASPRLPRASASPSVPPPPLRRAAPSIIPSPPESFSFDGADGGILVVESAEATPSPAAAANTAVVTVTADDGATDLSETRVAEAQVAPRALEPSPSPAHVHAHAPEPDIEPEHTIPLALTTPKPAPSHLAADDLDIDVQVEMPEVARESDDQTRPLGTASLEPHVVEDAIAHALAEAGMGGLDPVHTPEPDLIDEPTIALPQVLLAPRAEPLLPAFPSEPDLVATPAPPESEADDEATAVSPSVDGEAGVEMAGDEDERTLPLVSRSAPMAAPRSGVVVADRESLLDKLRRRAQAGPKLELASETSAEALGRLRRLAGSSHES
jgi:hypothetical protein